MDATRELRWSIGLALVLLAVAPTLKLTLAAAGTPAPWTPVLVAAPVNLAGAALAAFGMASTDPGTSARLLTLAGALVLLGDALLYTVLGLVT